MENQRSSPATSIDFSSTFTAASTSSSTATDPMVYDVFINHRGVDTKQTFASHVYRRLLSHGFRAFLDQQELQEGLNFPSQIVSAIRTASVHVAIFSPRYAESQWCLDELLLMRESGAPIIPIFYNVKPAELRWTDQNKNGVYAKAFHQLQMKKTYDSQNHQEKPRYDYATIQKWKNALCAVSDISGFDLEGAFSGDEIRMLDNVVQCVVKMVKKAELYVAKYPTGLDEKVKNFETTVLKKPRHTGKVQIVGIVGMGGMGKTTLALELFNRKSSNYNKSYFLADVRENARGSSIHSLQSKVMKGLTQLDFNIENIYEGTGKLKKHLQSCHILLILDDIDHENQLDAFLAVKDVLHSDSLIVITSRDKEVLTRSGVEESSIYKLTGLSTQHSLELFCSYAFSQCYPFGGFEDLVEKFLKACDGLPLSLKVFGAHLYGKKEISYWEDILYKVQVPTDIHNRLKISYDALNGEEQQIFLDVACFLIGEKKNTAIRLWNESGWKGSLGFQNLESKCLVDVDSNNNVHMHDHLRDLGRQIAEDKLPRRLWRPTKNIDDLLQQSSGITEVRGVRMFHNTGTDSHDKTLSWYRRRTQELFWNRVTKLRNTLHNTGVMNLQLLQTEGHLLERILRSVHSPNLIWLSWRDCPYSYLPSWIPMKNLRVLKVEGRALKTLWQSSSQAPFQLRELEISSRLSNISKSIGQLNYLERIVFDYVDLQKLPHEFFHLRSLKVFVLKWCMDLKALPDSFGNLRNLQHIQLCHCRWLEGLPDSFGNLRKLQHIELSECASLERLPDSFVNLTNLQHLELSECGCLGSLPDSFGNLRNLQHFELSGSCNLKRLPNSFGNLRNLQHFNLYWCENLLALPDSFGNLMNLQHIRFSGWRSLESLPDSFDNLINLQHIELSLLGSMERLPDFFGNLRSLQSIQLSGCWKLVGLPDSFCNLRNLEHIELSACWSLEGLPDFFGNLRNLQHVDLSGCLNLKRLPNSFGNLTNLQHINLYWCEKLEGLPDSFGNLKNLKHVYLSHCKNLQELACIRTLVYLEQLKALDCVKVKSIPGLAQLTKLKLLDVDGCLALQELDGVEHCVSLVKLNASSCPNLHFGAGVVSKLQQRKITIII